LQKMKKLKLMRIIDGGSGVADGAAAYFSTLSDVLYAALKKLEHYFNLRADELMLKRLFGEAVHIFIHEAAHAFTRAAIPWLDTLDEVEREFLDEVLSRLVERAVSEELRDELGLEEIIVEDLGEQLAELEFYPRLRGLRMGVEEYSALYSTFVKRLRQGEPLESLARWLLSIGRKRLRGG